MLGVALAWAENGLVEDIVRVMFGVLLMLKALVTLTPVLEANLQEYGSLKIVLHCIPAIYLKKVYQRALEIV